MKCLGFRGSLSRVSGVLLRFMGLVELVGLMRLVGCIGSRAQRVYGVQGIGIQPIGV